MISLYHYDRSTAAQRVRLGLEEKGLEWNSVIVDTALGDASQRPDDFHKYNPKGLIPLLKDGAFTLPESTLILEYLEDAYPITSIFAQKTQRSSQNAIVDAQNRRWNSCCQQNHRCLYSKPSYLQKNRQRTVGRLLCKNARRR